MVACAAAAGVVRWLNIKFKKKLNVRGRSPRICTQLTAGMRQMQRSRAQVKSLGAVNHGSKLYLDGRWMCGIEG